MSLVRTQQITRPKISSQWLQLPGGLPPGFPGGVPSGLPRGLLREPPGSIEPRKPGITLGSECQPFGHSTLCPANFASSGGVATGSDVAERLRAKVGQPVSLVARWIVDRRVIAISSSSRLLLPLFQFDFAAGCVRSGVEKTMAELVGVMDDDELACWFAQPNAWLNGAAPAELLLSDAQAVLAAARADRFVARG